MPSVLNGSFCSVMCVECVLKAMAGVVQGAVRFHDGIMGCMYILFFSTRKQEKSIACKDSRTAFYKEDEIGD